ncbi:hypothetical protein CHARACLAT_032519 [Characodon lateralis]|uniref:Uncharacterized protein n=1 Tax=Characodon lateralis TaxID=208331 RepID=A0ABU7EZT7_9TELE|nr:hypothetical protein [Characodon lateralis]
MDYCLKVLPWEEGFHPIMSSGSSVTTKLLTGFLLYWAKEAQSEGEDPIVLSKNIFQQAQGDVISSISFLFGCSMNCMNVAASMLLFCLVFSFTKLLHSDAFSVFYKVLSFLLKLTEKTKLCFYIFYKYKLINNPWSISLPRT